MDFRKLNDCTRKDTQPLPRIDESLDALGGACFFSTLDLASGYWQVVMDPKSKEKNCIYNTLWAIPVSGHAIWPL